MESGGCVSGKCFKAQALALQVRSNQVANPKAARKIQLENVTNVLNTASSLLTQTLASNKGNAPKATTTGGRRGPKPVPRGPVTGKIIKPRDSEGNLTI